LMNKPLLHFTKSFPFKESRESFPASHAISFFFFWGHWWNYCTRMRKSRADNWTTCAVAIVALANTVWVATMWENGWKNRIRYKFVVFFFYFRFALFYFLISFHFVYLVFHFVWSFLLVFILL
jgi:hypothetical protein